MSSYTPTRIQSLEKHTLQVQTKIGRFSDLKGAQTIPSGAAQTLPIRQM